MTKLEAIEIAQKHLKNEVGIVRLVDCEREVQIAKIALILTGVLVHEFKKYGKCAKILGHSHIEWYWKIDKKEALKIWEEAENVWQNKKHVNSTILICRYFIEEGDSIDILEERKKQYVLEMYEEKYLYFKM